MRTWIVMVVASIVVAGVTPSQAQAPTLQDAIASATRAEARALAAAQETPEFLVYTRTPAYQAWAASRVALTQLQQIALQATADKAPAAPAPEKAK